MIVRLIGGVAHNRVETFLDGMTRVEVAGAGLARGGPTRHAYEVFALHRHPGYHMEYIGIHVDLMEVIKKR